MSKYGRTWWGQQWLQALSKIDYSNRLPRGRSYANTGKVAAIKITGNKIKGKVKGSRRTPYTSEVIVTPFSIKEQQIFVQEIKDNPLLVAQLLNRQLPQELIDIANKHGIRVFPRDWTDLVLNCTCPDWAVPCKHLAAVIYSIANEIDQNPFLIFELHQFDLIKELTRKGVPLLNQTSERIFSLANCLSDQPDVSSEHHAGVMPDFSKIENLLETIPKLFNDEPLFYTRNFKTIIEQHYKRQAKHVKKFTDLFQEEVTPLNDAYRYAPYEVKLNENGTVTLITTQDQLPQNLELPELLPFLLQTQHKNLFKYHPSFVLFYQTFVFIRTLLEKGAILPQLFFDGEIKYRILWVPALINTSVQTAFDDLLKLVPLGLFSTGESSLEGEEQSEVYLKTTEALTLLCSHFASFIVKHCYKYAWPASQVKGDKIEKLFFKNTAHWFSGFSEQETPNTIQLWLSRFFLSLKAFSPTFQVLELESGRFEIAVLIQNNKAIMETPLRLQEFMAQQQYPQFEVLKALELLSHYLPDLRKSIASHGAMALSYSSDRFAEIMSEVLPVIKLFGIKILLPKALQRIYKPQLTLSLSPRANHRKYLSLQDLLDYNWKVAMGDTFIEKEEFLKLVEHSSGLVKIRDQYVMMDEGDISKMLKKLDKLTQPKPFALLQAALSEDYEGSNVQIDDSLRHQIKEMLKVGSEVAPTELNAELRHYQERGYNWLCKNATLGLGAILADDMGLGKTIQIISVLLKFKEMKVLAKNPALIIVPTSLVSNWKSEIEKFAPVLSTAIYHGAKREVNFNDFDVLITTYGLARSENEKFRKVKWHAVIIDEAQNIKNASTAQTKAVKQIKAKVKIAMSGTPVENRLLEYWSIFDFTNPGYLGTMAWFDEQYGKPIELRQDRAKLEKFRKITAPFIMRRVKTDKSIISDLPEKIETNQICTLTKEQSALYTNITERLLDEVENAEGINRKGMILKLLTLLKQVCNHPAQYLKTDTAFKAEESGKLMLLFGLLDTIYENGEKVLIFSQYKEMGSLLCQAIEGRYRKMALQLHGGNSRKERDQMVDAFQNDPRSDTFILSLKAGGTGLNLTSGNHVIHYDLWWNPAVEAQATDRAFRIGQTKNVMVHRMITQGTLEEKIDTMILKKKELANLAVSHGEKWIGDLSNKDLRELVKLG